MLVPRLLVVVSCLWLVVATACSGGSSGGGTAAAQPNCAVGSSTGGASTTLCLVSCNLGCNQGGCAVTDIAENQQIILTFNQNIDPASVNPSTIALQTAAGSEPVGRYVTTGSTVVFVPDVLVVGSTSFFGFQTNQTYELTLPGGPNEINALRSVDGDVLSAPISCSLAVTRGLVDFDGVPPVGTLLQPTAKTEVDPTAPIVIQFSELLDVTPFLQASGASQPIMVAVSQVQQGRSGVECNSLSAPTFVSGRWEVDNDVILQRTTVTFSPDSPLPQAACITANITTAVRDLSGKSASPQRFQWVTSGQKGNPVSIEEDFSDTLQFDRDASSGSWLGGATPGTLGWDGLHGDFRPVLGRQLGVNMFEWNTDAQAIPATQTLSGQAETVTDGVFRFSRFVIPPGVTVRFVGSKPAQIHVRGKLDIGGVLDLSGESLILHNGTTPSGQAGSRAGAGGGDGGRGGDKCDGLGYQAKFDGVPGGDVTVPASHAYAGQTAGTGGEAGTLYPADGLNASIVAEYRGVFSAQAGTGGSGGGNASAGTNGSVDPSGFTNLPLPPDTVGGIRFPLYDASGVPAPLPPALVGTPFGTFDHLLVGGAGGGGSGSHPLNASIGAGPNQNRWWSGAAGGGGGGAVGLRVGYDFAISATGQVLARGASTQAGSRASNLFSPGGAGAGGSIVIQSAVVPRIDGLLDTTGGTGAVMTYQPTSSTGEGILVARITSGNGGTGFYRVEGPGMPPADPSDWTGPAQPAPTAENVGTLPVGHEDDLVGLQSKWYPTNEAFAPEFLRYEIEATVDGMPVVFSDDDAFGNDAVGPNSAVQFYVQGATVAPGATVLPGQESEWRRYVGDHAPPGQESLIDDSATTFRFTLLFDRSLVNSVSVQKVSFHYRPFISN